MSRVKVSMVAIVYETDPMAFAIACVPLTFIYPALCHYKAVARSKGSRLMDILLVGLGIVVMVFVTGVTLATWNDTESTPECRLDPPTAPAAGTPIDPGS